VTPAEYFLTRPLPERTHLKRQVYISLTISCISQLRVHPRDLKARSGQSLFRANLKPCGRGGIGRRIGLKRNLSARWEIGDAELLKVGEPCNMASPFRLPSGERV